MPIVYNEISTLFKREATRISFSFNDQEARSFIRQPLSITECHYEHIGGSAGVSTVVTISLRDYLVEDYFISVVCEDVEAFVRHQTKNFIQFSLTTSNTYGDQKMLETNINRMCRCLENSLQSRKEKLKVEQFSLSVLEISQAVSAVNLLDREILQIVTVHLPFEDHLFMADDFIPLMKGQGRRKLDLRIHLHDFSLKVLEEVRKLLSSTSNQLNSITINYKNVDEKCIELIAETEHLPEEKTVKFSIDHSADPIEEIAMLNLSDNRFTLNIFEIPSIMMSIASPLGCFEIQTLRKVSRGIRQCVDYVKPDPHIHRCFIRVGNSLRVRIDSMMNRPIWAHYKGSLEQEAVRVVNDFDSNTRHQKSCMDNLNIDMDKEICKLKEEVDPALSPNCSEMS
ncbi:hypothetical protein GCK72_021122 [Caenorhabditis remanei]|uniref:Uncharacterized protein n=1 Tax=Caenorhabditis remanei TaxID=31234 RepID=A0A6A5GJQ3_CAERE|nr:hypothetical protein GCK72_021122 [Caenorhabditis remanei]KAF1754559.1 hypothetical protein GCK72_021122 [Caenorhabditis remanei]